MALSNKHIEITVKQLPGADKCSVGMFMILVPSHVEYPFKDVDELKKVWDDYVNPSDPHV